MRETLLFVMVAGALASGSTPKQQTNPATSQQTKTAPKPAPIEKKPASSGGEQSSCPGTDARQLSCEAITALATVRQANLMRDNNWISLVTALVAGFAAIFAYKAANAGTKSYKAFVAAEDANLAVEFVNGTWIESMVEGVRQPDTYHLTAVITNIGRSTARVHYCAVASVADAERIEIDKTLKKDESIEEGWRIMLPSLDVFTFVVNYSSSIRPSAMLTLTAQPERVRDQRRVIAKVLQSQIVGLEGAD